MGEVYLAEDSELHRNVALKVLRSDVSSNRDRMRRFKQEATAAAALDHPNIGQVVWLADGRGLAVIAPESGMPTNQIWHVSYPDGEVRKITYDVNNYSQLSLTADSSALVTVQTEGASSVWVSPQGNTGGVSNIWSLPLDGGKPVQLTDFKTDQNFWYAFSRDGKQLALSRGTETSDAILIRDFR